MWNETNNYIISGNALTREMDLYHLIVAPSYACDLRCKHCYLPDHAADTIPLEKLFGIIDEWEDIVLEDRGRLEGIFHLKGGEVAVMPYFDDVLRYIRDLGTLRLMLTTNGVRWAESAIRLLAECRDALEGNVIVNVSLDGASAETHEYIRGGHIRADPGIHREDGTRGNSRSHQFRS
jgi:MoaA/NifB/PqqE/SkfB family radical SAM enzyme